MFARNLVAIPFVALVIVERLGIRDANRAARSTADGQFGISRGQVRSVDKDAGALVGWNEKGMVRELRGRVDASCANDSSHGSNLHSHLRQCVGNEFPFGRRKA